MAGTTEDVRQYMASNGEQVPDSTTFASKMSDPAYAEHVRQYMSSVGESVPDSNTFYTTYGKPAAPISFKSVRAHALDAGYTGLTPAEKQALDSGLAQVFTGPDAAAHIASTHLQMDQEAGVDSPQGLASKHAQEDPYAITTRQMLLPTTAAAVDANQSGDPTRQSSLGQLTLDVGHDVGSFPGRVVSAAGEGLTGGGLTGMAQSQADPLGSNFVSSILKDPLTGYSLGAPAVGRLVGGLATKGLSAAVPAIVEKAPWLATQAERAYAPVQAIADWAAPKAAAIAEAHPTLSTYVPSIAKNAVTGFGTGLAASGLEHGLYTKSDYVPDNTNFSPDLSSGVQQSLLSTAFPLVAGGLAGALSGVFRANAIRNFPGQRPMEAMATKQNINQVMTPAERELILQRVTDNPVGSYSQSGYAAAAEQLQKEAKIPMNEALAQTQEAWRQKMQSGEMPPMTLNDMMSLGQDESETAAARGFGVGKSGKWTEDAIQDLGNTIGALYTRHLKLSPELERAQSALTKMSPEAAEAELIKIANGESDLYSPDQHKTDLAHKLGYIKDNETLNDVSAKDRPKLDAALQISPWAESYQGLISAAKLPPEVAEHIAPAGDVISPELPSRPTDRWEYAPDDNESALPDEIATPGEQSYPAAIGRGTYTPDVRIAGTGEKYVTPMSTVPIRAALNKNIYNRAVGDNANAAREVSGNVKSVIRDFLDRYGYTEALSKLDQEANMKYALGGKMGTYIQKSPTRGQPMRWNLGPISPYTYDISVNNYNKPAWNYAAHRAINKLIAPVAGSRASEQDKTKTKQ